MTSCLLISQNVICRVAKLHTVMHGNVILAFSYPFTSMLSHNSINLYYIIDMHGMHEAKYLPYS